MLRYHQLVDRSKHDAIIYLATKDKPSEFKLYSDNGIITCVWEMAVLWHERNAWVKHVLQNHKQPDFIAYLADQMNDTL